MSISKAKAKPQYPSAEERSAARRYLEHDYAARKLGGQAGREANQHAQAIDEEHPRARDIALTGTARELGELPKHLREHQRWSRQRAGISPEEARRIRHEYRTRPYREPEEEPEGQPRRSRARAAAGWAWQAAGDAGRNAAGAASGAISAAGDSNWSELIADFFLAGMLLSLAYLALTRTRSISSLFLGATNVARAVVSPNVDPLNPTIKL